MARRLGQRFRRRRARARRSVPDEVPAPVVDRGSFTHAFCGECGWEGPGRRSRGVAAQDANLHLIGGCAGGPTPLPQAWDGTAPEDPNQIPTSV